MKHLMRLMILLVITCSLAACGGHDGHGQHADYMGKVQTVDAQTVSEWYGQDRSFRILDVRTEQEFNKEGHAPLAELVTWSYQGKKAGVNEAFIETVPERFGKDETIVILCSLGMRATEAAYALQQAGFTAVYVFPGGYQGHHMAGFPAGDGWRAAGLPME
ncbi:MAG: rhodanese-like domain-containing protein [Gammaproteobacteria bacterium]